MGKKGRAEFGTPKWISNNIKSKGLQKLRWFCQMCDKQCRDANGFKCHVSSESHQRQLLLFGDNPGRYLAGYSQDFEKAFNLILRRQFNQKRVLANYVYQQYISDKQHVHMNATCWVTLTSYVKHLERCGKAEVDQTEKGWWITWILKDPEEEAREKKAAKKEKMAKDDEERIKEYIDAQIDKALEQRKNDAEFIATELLINEDEELVIDMDIKDFSKVKTNEKKEFINPLKDFTSPCDKPKKTYEKRKLTAFEEVMAQEIKKKKLQEKNDPNIANCWLMKGIIVKIVTKSLGDKYYKKKGHTVDIIDDFAAIVSLNDGGGKVKLDQEHLETVIPQVGREVVILWGKFEGSTAILKEIDTKKFLATLRLESGDKVKLPYEQFSKRYDDDIIVVSDSTSMSNVKREFIEVM